MKHHTRHSPTAMVIHWIAALMILCSIAMAVYMAGLQVSPAKLKLYNWHKWLGIIILMLSCLRLAWRLTHRPPQDLPMPAWQRRAAHVTHWAMYALSIAVPLAGCAYSSASGFPVVVFGVLPLPDLVAPEKALAQDLKSLHAGLGIALGTLIAVHVAAVLKHQFLNRDSILSRMLPFESKA